MDVDPAVAAALGISLGTLLLGFIIGFLLSRRGRRLRVEWRLSVEANGDDHDHDRPDVMPPPEPER